MSLRTLFQRLYATATAQGEDSAALEGGAAITVRAQGRRRQVILARPSAPLGLVETATFQRHGQIPPDAVGVCFFPTRAGLYRVAFTWEDAPPTASLFDLIPAEPAPYRLPEVADLPDHL